LGDPKKKQKTYKTPKRPYVYETLMEELRTIGAYGLRNKRELWKAHTELSHMRGRARDLLSLDAEEKVERQQQIINKLAIRGLVMENGRLEDLFQARQLITHGHIAINGRKVTSPSYQIKITDEETLDYAVSSPYHNPDHPLRRELEVEEAVAAEPSREARQLE
jgi:small subunit ribosomal protein S4